MRKVITAVMLLAFAASCGSNTRVKTLRVGLVALNTARDATLAVSKQREAQIVAAAPSREMGQAELAVWRAKVDTVFAALDVAYHAVHDAYLLSSAKSASEAGAAVAKALALAKELTR